MYEEKLITLFNKALKDEYTAVLIYDKMASFLVGVKGTAVAKELTTHAKEEHAHAQKIVCYMTNHGLEGDMVFTIDQIISYVSKFITLKIGDLIFTGTPAGVGSVRIGDKLEGFINKERVFSLNIK